MIELFRADDFIKNFEKRFSKRVYKIPLNYADGRSVLLLMCKCSRRWVALPYCSEAYVQTDMGGFSETPPFTFVESSDGNLFCTKHIRWQIRDTRAWSNNVYAEKLNFSIALTDDNPMNLLSSNIRRKIHKAYSLGVEVKSSGKKLIADFHKVYSRRMFELGSPCASKQATNSQIAKVGRCYICCIPGRCSHRGGNALPKRRQLVRKHIICNRHSLQPSLYELCTSLRNDFLCPKAPLRRLLSRSQHKTQQCSYIQKPLSTT